MSSGKSWEACMKEKSMLENEIRHKRREARDTDLKGASQHVESIPDVRMRLRRLLRGHTAKIYAVHWSADSRRLVSASQDKSLFVWDTISAQKLIKINLESAWVMTCAYSPTGTMIASGGLDSVVSVYNVEMEYAKGESKAVQVLGGHESYVSCCRFLNPDGGKMITSSGDSKCRLFDVTNGAIISEFAGHSGDCMAISVGPNPNIFVSGACDGCAKVWDVRTGMCHQTFKSDDDNQHDINAVEFFPNGSTFAAAGDEGSCGLFDLRSDQCIQRYGGGERTANTSVAFSRSGRLLFAGSENCNVNIYDTLKGTRCGVIGAHDNRVSSISVPSDGSALCTSSWDGTIKVFTV